jgi:23S rRNA pseudouridine1911/1915/1917 synthase
LKIEVGTVKHTGLVAPNSTFSFQVTADEANTRIDKYISDQFSHYSRSYFQQLIEKGCITINGKVINKPKTIINSDDTVTITFPPARSIDVDQAFNKKNIDIDILEENKHPLIINKPANLMVHSPNHYNTDATVADWVTQYDNTIKEVGPVDRPGIVHRLDKDTSGILVIPRTNYAHGLFGEMFRNRTIQKTYYAIVKGHTDPQGTIEAPIGRDPVHRTRMKAFPIDYNPLLDEKYTNVKVRPATTHYRVIEYFDNATLLEVKPITGRTHQIRVHLQFIGHTIIGDTIYGAASKLIGRQALHAHTISFEFDDVEHTFTAPLPADFTDLIESLRKSRPQLKAVSK